MKNGEKVLALAELGCFYLFFTILNLKDKRFQLPPPTPTETFA